MRKLIVPACIALALGIACAVILLVNRRPGQALQFDPPLIDLTGRFFLTGETIACEARLRNSSSTPITVTRIPKSCGCMTLGQDGALSLPITLAPGQSYPLRIEIATDGRSGPQAFDLQALGTAAGRTLPPAYVMVNAVLRTTLLTVPDEVDLELGHEEAMRPVARTIMLADEWPGAGVGIEKVESTAGDRMELTLRPTQGEVTIDGLDLKKRFLLDVRYTPPAGARDFAETITITPVRPEAGPVRIKFRGKIRPEYQFQPDSLTFFHAEAGAVSTRILEYHYRDEKYRDARPVGLPAGITVEELDHAAGLRRFRIGCAAPRALGAVTRDLQFEVGEGRTVRIPVTILVDAG